MQNAGILFVVAKTAMFKKKLFQQFTRHMERHCCNERPKMLAAREVNGKKQLKKKHAVK